jgi:hypothetical protein
MWYIDNWGLILKLLALLVINSCQQLQSKGNVTMKIINEKESPNNIKCTAGLTGGCGVVENIKIIIIL